MTGSVTGILPWLSVVTAALFATALLLAATTIVVRIRSTRKAARRARLDAAWTPLLMEILSGDRPPKALAGAVAERDRLLLADFLVRFVRRLKGEERELVGRLARPYLGAIARRLSVRNAERRARAVQTLSLLGGKAYGPLLVRALDDPAPLVALVAARGLAAGHDPHHIAPILAHLPRFAGWSPRYLSAMLANMGPQAAPPLRALLGDAAQLVRVRAIAADALRLLRDLSAADVAAAVVSGPADRELAAACLRLLAALGQPRHLPRARSLVGAGDAVVRAAATRALAALGGGDEIPALRAALEDPSPWVAMEAAQGLLAAGGAAVLREVAASGHPRAVLAQQVLREAA